MGDDEGRTPEEIARERAEVRKGVAAFLNRRYGDATGRDPGQGGTGKRRRVADRPGDGAGVHEQKVFGATAETVGDGDGDRTGQVGNIPHMAGRPMRVFQLDHPPQEGTMDEQQREAERQMARAVFDRWLTTQTAHIPRTRHRGEMTPPTSLADRYIGQQELITRAMREQKDGR